MGQFSDVLNIWLSTLGWMAALAVCFALLSRVMPCNPGMHWWKDRTALMTDLIYWFIVPLFLRIFRILMLATGIGLLYGADDKEAIQDFLMHGYGTLGALPLWLQALLILVFGDVILYWIHRIFHTRRAWKVHAIHHSPKMLDWVSTQRFHPINNLLAFSLTDVILLMIGFSPAALALLSPFNIAYSALVHANLNWTFGPFRYVLASPVFHRWHHTHPSKGGNRNFAPTFPVLDVIFGTFYMPKGELPEHYGVTDHDFPEDFWGQFMYPFRMAEKDKQKQ